MARVKFIHTADLHLDTPFRGLTQINSELAAKVKNATFKAFENIVDKCISEQVDFLIIAGDIFDRESKSLGAQLKFVDQLKRLSKKGISTYFICGNHDPLCSWMENLDLPEKVFRLGSQCVETHTFFKNGNALANICGISYQDKALVENVSLNYINDDKDVPFGIALLHGNVSGNTSHGNYAPFSIEDLENNTFDYWALGHIHLRQILKGKDPVIIYPGNPQGRDFGEMGERGCFVVELSTDSNPTITFSPTHLIRFEDIQVDLTGVCENSELINKIRNEVAALGDISVDDNLIIRLTLNGRTPLHLILADEGNKSSILDNLNEGAFLGSSFKYFDKMIVSTQPELDLEELKNASNFVASILTEFEAFENDCHKNDELIRRLTGELSSPQIRKLLIELTVRDKQEIFEQAKLGLLDKFSIE